MLLKRLTLIAGLCVLFTGCSIFSGGKEVDKDLTAYEADSTARTGVRYLFGRGVHQDNVQAFQYFYKAATKGNVFAQNEIAYLYAAGKGTRKDYRQSLFWYEKAARSGLASAQYNLGLMYLHGLGTKADKERGMKWILSSARRGFEPAKLMVEAA